MGLFARVCEHIYFLTEFMAVSLFPPLPEELWEETFQRNRTVHIDLKQARSQHTSSNIQNSRILAVTSMLPNTYKQRHAWIKTQVEHSVNK